MSQISIRHRIQDGFVQFDCERIGVIDLEKRYRRQEFFQRRQDREPCGFRDILRTGDADCMQKLVFAYPGHLDDLNDQTFDELLDEFWHAQLNGNHGLQTGDFGPGELPERRMGPAFIVGDVGVIKDKDQIVVCRITDATVCGRQTWTPTPEEARFIDESTADAEQRVKFGEYVVRNGSLVGALFAALGDY